MVNVQRVSLELRTCPAYFAFMKKMTKNRQRLRGDRVSDPFAREYFNAMYGWEGVVRHLLSSCLQSCPERILSYWDSNSLWHQQFREIDFVGGTSDNPSIFVEIKTRSLSALCKDGSGWSQLYKSLDIARVRWPSVGGFCVNVAMGDILGTEPECPFCVPLPKTGSELLERAKEEIVWFRGREVADYAIEIGAYTADEIAQLPILRSQMNNPMQVLKEPSS